MTMFWRTITSSRATYATLEPSISWRYHTRLSGPNEGYGFSSSPTPHQSLEGHRESIRTFLAQIDPTTGYIEDD